MTISQGRFLKKELFNVKTRLKVTSFLYIISLNFYEFGPSADTLSSDQKVENHLEAKSDHMADATKPIS